MLKLLITFVLLCSVAHGLNPNHNITTCPSIFEYKYQNGSCLPTCPSPYQDDMLGGFSFCNSPCHLSFYNPFKKTCVNSCGPEFIRIEDDISYCDENEDEESDSDDEVFWVTLGIYLRYNISLSDFKAQNYPIKFLDLLAGLLDLEASDIDIISLREGSTIIESEIVLKSEADPRSKIATKTKANTMVQKLTSAAKSKGLDFDDISVLDYRFSTVASEEDKVESIKLSSKTKTFVIIIIAVVGGAVVIAAASVLIYEIKRRSLKIIALDRSKSYKIEEGSVEVKSQKKDEETSILGENSRIQGTDNSRVHASEHSKTQPLENSENDMSRTEAFQLAIKTDLEQDQSPKKITLAVKEKVKPTEVENVKPVSFRDIMKNIV